MVKSDTVVQRHTISSQKHRGVLYQIWCPEGLNVRSDNAPLPSVDVLNQRSHSMMHCIMMRGRSPGWPHLSFSAVRRAFNLLAHRPSFSWHCVASFDSHSQRQV